MVFGIHRCKPVLYRTDFFQAHFLGLAGIADQGTPGKSHDAASRISRRSLGGKRPELSHERALLDDHNPITAAMNGFEQAEAFALALSPVLAARVCPELLVQDELDHSCRLTAQESS